VDSNHKIYNYVDSFERIDGILAQPLGDFEERKDLPDRDKLTFQNGYYAYCSALFIDIRDSSELPNIYNRPALAKLYRAFISEMVAVLNGHANAREINIVGDCVWGVFNTSQKTQIDEVFSTACRINSLVKVLNHKLAQAKYKTPIRVGIGMSYGRALMIKAGHFSSGINDVVYMGDVVNQASKLAAKGGGTELSQPIVMDGVFKQNLNEHNTSLVYSTNISSVYVANAINVIMDKWFDENCT
jgi:class 3 adenylate cyclase